MKLSTKLIILILITLSISLLVNQLIIQYYLNTYKSIAWFSHVYFPYDSYRITRYFLTVDNEIGQNILIVTFLSGFITLMLGFAIIRPSIKQPKTSARHGTARFATVKEIEKTNMLQDPTKKDKVEKRYGVIVGAIKHASGNKIVRYDTQEQEKLRVLMHFGQQHMLLVAPTGSGKGVGIVTPNLLNYPESIFMYDMKGADWELTAGHRSRNLNNICIKFEPTNDDGSSCMYNPMDFIIPGTPQEVNESGVLAHMLVDSDGKGIDGDHWKTNATKLLAAAILHIIYTKKEKNLASVTAFLSGINPDTGDAYNDVKEWLGEMCDKNNFGIPHLEAYAYYHNMSVDEARLKVGNLFDGKGYNKFIKQVASALYNTPEKELGSIISSANTPLDLFNDPIIAKNTSTSTIKLTDFQSGPKPVTLYIVVRPKDQERIRPITRILLTQLIDTVQETEKNKQRELLFLLDEFATLRKMPVVARALATIRSFRARFLLVVQDLSQLEEYYDKLSSSIISNSGIRIYYPANDSKTNEQAAKSTGETTYVSESVSVSQQKTALFNIEGLFGNNSVSTSYQETQRTLLTSNEVSTMGINKNTLIFREGQHVILGDAYKYFEDPTITSILNLPLTQRT